MHRLEIGIVDLVTKGPTRALWARVMHPNMASIMPQMVGVWCEEEGHSVSFVCYTGLEELMAELPRDIDLLFVSAFSQAAQTAYAISNLFRRHGTVTALGGPHARSVSRQPARLRGLRESATRRRRGELHARPCAGRFVEIEREREGAVDLLRGLSGQAEGKGKMYLYA